MKGNNVRAVRVDDEPWTEAIPWYESARPMSWIGHLTSTLVAVLIAGLFTFAALREYVKWSVKNAAQELRQELKR